MKRTFVCLLLVASLALPTSPVVFASYSPGQEIVKLRDQYSKTIVGENGNLILTSYLGSIHYEDTSGDFQPIDTTIVSSGKLQWDWEVTTGHWQLFIKNDTTVGIKKGNSWMGTRLHGIAYLNITTKDYTIIQTTNTISPTVSGNSIKWENILYGVDYVVRYTNDSFKEDIVIKQEARDLLASPGYRPSDYGYSAQNTLLVPIFEADWSQSLPMKLWDGTVVNPGEAEHEEIIYLESPAKDKYFDTKLVSFLPAGYAVSANPINPENPEEEWRYASEKIRKRLIEKNDKHWLLIGVRITALNQMPKGSIIFDPTETLRPNAVGDETNLSKSGSGGYNYDRVDDVTHDEAATFVYTFNLSYKRDLYNLPAPSGSGTINFIKVYARCITELTPDQTCLKIVIKSGTGTGAPNTVSEGSGITLTLDWTTYLNQWSTNPATGNPWTWDEIGKLQIGVSLRSPISDYEEMSSCTQVYVEVDYTLVAPIVTTQAATNVGVTTATFNGNITSTGGATVTTRGFKYGLTETDTWDIHEDGTFGEGTYALGETGLSAGTTYYVRAYATNTVGTAYGSYVEFTTIGPPDIATYAATNVASTTARLNSTLEDDGGDTCEVRFQYNTSENWTTCDNTSWVDGYTSGQYPYVDIDSLLYNTLYYFRVQARNVAGTSDGSALTFTTESAVLVPTNFKSFPEATLVKLSWTAGEGSTDTLVRQKAGTYPTSVTDGQLVYRGMLNSFAHTGLTPGITYYYSAWGASGDNFSTSYAMVVATTFGAPAAGDIPGAPTVPPTWFQTPDYTIFVALPFYDVINAFFDAYEMPRASGWFFTAMFGCVGFGIFVFAVSRHPMPPLIALAVALATVSLIKLVPMYMMAFAVIFMLGALQLGKR